MSVLPEESAGWTGTPGVVGHRAGRDFAPEFRVVAASRDGDRVAVEAIDAVAGLGLRLAVELTAQGLVKVRAEVTNQGDSPYDVHGVTPLLPVPTSATELLDFTGRHLRERAPVRTPFTPGLRVRENRTGRTGFDSAYLLAAGTAGFGNRAGEVWAVHVAWSGNHREVAERTFHSISLLGGGELLAPGEVVLQPGESYASPGCTARTASASTGCPTASTPTCAPGRATPPSPGRSWSTPGRPCTSTTTSPA
ncbi:glycoside hydrolase family 36 N-terminal domain-containing protein [Actinokineospora soli]|uniref:Glycoside hydrolase family 36 N-terminal domain-containing protein n=1 Tax=Actinokineospora soli TaxID=1048753 RepID=A0ABW2TNT6_9PSEU